MAINLLPPFSSQEAIMIKEMSIDLETYSDVNITKCGAYKYAESDEFEILLFGVSVDGGPVKVYDLACGDTIPEEILAALSDENVTKWVSMLPLSGFVSPTG